MSDKTYHGGLNGQPPFRVLPKLTAEDTPFWTGGRDNTLLVAWCEACARWHHPPAGICPNCLSRAVGFKAVSGHGTVYSYTVNVQPWNPTFEHPYVIAVIELDEQADLRLISNVYGCSPEAVHIDMRVEVFFEPYEDVWLPLFRPLKAGV